MSPFRGRQVGSAEEDKLVQQSRKEGPTQDNKMFQQRGPRCYNRGGNDVKKNKDKDKDKMFKRIQGSPRVNKFHEIFKTDQNECQIFGGIKRRLLVAMQFTCSRMDSLPLY